ncbi:hypothetical protein D3C71_52720 [compost metagenome]|jgi:hypothetical protein
MRIFKILFLSTLFFLATGLQKIYSQDNWEYAIDTIKLSEAEVVDSVIIKMLDSAFTFLRLPPLEYGPYYYTLMIRKDTIPVIRPYCKIDLIVEDYFIKNRSLDLDMFNQYDKLLFNYKGVQILIYYDVQSNNTFALQFFKSTNKISNFYFYYKRNKANPNLILSSNWNYAENVQFWIGKKIFTFKGYKLNIDEDLYR